MKVSENQEKLFKAAITMTEAGIASFDECVDALKKFKGDENAACQYLLEMNNNGSSNSFNVCDSNININTTTGSTATKQ